MFEGRGAAEVTIFNPALTDNELVTLVTNFTTYRQRNGTIVITCGDQVNGVDISLKEMLEATMKQCSMAPAFKTKVGAEGTAIISISSRKKNLFKLALNAREFVGAGANVGKTAYSVGDNSGTRTGSTARPFKTIVFRSYDQGVPSNDVNDWIIFPAADVEGDATIAFKIGEDRGYTVTATAYDPTEKNYRVIIGDPSTVLSGIPVIPGTTDSGSDVILIIGQSNASGYSGTGYDPAIDTTNPRILQRVSVLSQAGQIILAQDPLWMPDHPADGNIGFPMSFARQYIQSLPSNRNLILVPQAIGGTGFVDNDWNPGNPKYNDAVAATLAVLQINPNNRLTAILWNQGEQDSDRITKVAYATAIDAMITSLRSATNSPTAVFVAGGAVPNWTLTNTSRQGISQAQRELPGRLPYTAFAESTGLSDRGDTVHFDAPSYRILGQRYYQQYLIGKTRTSVTIPTISNIVITPQVSNATVDWTQNGTSTSFTYNYKKTSDSSWSADVTTNSKPITLSSLNGGTNYDFRVKITNAAGTSSYYTQSFSTPGTINIPASILRVTYDNGIIDTSSNNYTLTAIDCGTETSNSRSGSVLACYPNGSTIYPRIIISDLTLPANYTKASWIRARGGAYSANILSGNGSHAFYLKEGSYKVTAGHNYQLEFIQDPNPIDVDVWYHFAVTFNKSTQTMSLYRDGVKVNDTSTAWWDNGNFNGHSEIIRIATLADNYYNWTGYLDNTTMWDIALTDAQILAVYQSEI